MSCPQPLVYEINTRCWLRELSRQAGVPLTLADVPETEIESWRRLGFTHIWLMGVWTVGPRSRAHSFQSQNQASTGPTVDAEDILGSPYAVADYQVSPALGGEKALGLFRARLASAGLKLLLDFVPNHVGLDHPWLVRRPDLFVQARPKAAGAFLQQTRSGPRWLAHGRDPNFEPWRDTAQLDYRNPETRAAMLGLVLNIAGLCDGLRCDMAMLVLNEVFQSTFPLIPTLSPSGGEREFNPLPEFWAEAIPAVKKIYPEFLFLAEVYWGLEARLQELGFDYTYDKIFYDHLVARRAKELHRYMLEVSPRFLQASAHFLENHDEARIASLLTTEEHRPAALSLLGLPGLRLLHEGQLTGATKKASVHLGCRPTEPPNTEIRALYETLLLTLQKTSIGRGQVEVLEPAEAWPGNPTAENFILIQWQAQPREFDLVVVNLAPHPSQCYAQLRIPELAATDWNMENLLGAEAFVRPGPELQERGLYLDVPGHAAQLFRCRRVEG